MSVSAPEFPPSAVIHPNIDVFAQYALQRLSRGSPAERADAVGMLGAVRSGRLRGIYKEDQQVPALRARALGRGWWQVVPKTEDAALLLDPASPQRGAPLIVFRDVVRSVPARLDPALRKAWAAGVQLFASPAGTCRVSDGSVFDQAELTPVSLLSSLVVPPLICQIPAGPATDSPVADRFVPAHPRRFCTPGQQNSDTCKKLADPRPVNRVVIHTLAMRSTSKQSAAARIVADWQLAPPLGKEAGAHYIVDRDGSIVQMVSEKDVAFHARRANPDSIGIEHADLCNDPSPYTDRLYERSAELVRDICRRHRITPSRTTILGHLEAAPLDGHTDPGPYWDWDYYLALVRWNPAVPGTHPARAVRAAVDQPAPPTGWSRRLRRAIEDAFCAGATDPWGAAFWVGKATADQAPPAEFRALVFESGRYSVSLWWPHVLGASRSVPVEISAACTMTGPPCTPFGPRTVRVDQSAPSGGWAPTGIVLTITQPTDVRVRIHRTGAARGFVVADAVRLFKS